MVHPSLSDQISLLKSLHSLNFQNESVSQLEKIIRTVEGSELVSLCVLKSLLPHVNSRDGLKNLSHLFVRQTSDILSGILNNESRSLEALQIVKDFLALCFCQVSNFPIQIGSRMQADLDFVDVLPSLASVYMDLSIAALGNKEKIKKASRQLYSSLMLDLNTRCVKTALLEVSLCTPQGARLLWPLLRKMLLEPPETITAMDYLLHTVAVRRWMLVSDSLREKLQNVRTPKAPPKFVEWLSPRWPKAAEFFPLDKSLKGRHITEVMLSLDKAAVEELIDVFSECLWATQQGNKAEINKAEINKEVPMETEEPVDQLFIIDKTGTSLVTDSEKEPPAKKRRKDSSARHNQRENFELTVEADNSQETNEFIDISDKEGEDVGFDENPSPADSDNGDDNSKDEEEMEEIISVEGSEDNGEKEREDVIFVEGNEDSDDDEEEKEEDNVSKGKKGKKTSETSILHTDHSTIYQYLDEDNNSEKIDSCKHNLRSNSHKSQAYDKEPEVENIDGMKVTVYSAPEDNEERSEETKERMKSYMEVLSLEEEELPDLGDNVSQNLRAIRQSIDERRSESQNVIQSSSESELEVEEVLSETQEKDSETEKDGALTMWLRSPQKSYKRINQDKEKLKASAEDRTPAEQAKSPARKSAADFFCQSEKDTFTSMSSSKRKSRSPTKITPKTQASPSSSSPPPSQVERSRKTSAYPNDSDSSFRLAEKSPKKLSKPGHDLQIKQSSPLSGQNFSPKTPVIKKAKHSPNDSGLDQKSPKSTPKNVKSPAKKTGSSVKKQTKKTGTPKRTYYLRNLTEDSQEEPAEKQTTVSMDNGSSAHLTTLKRKRTKSEPGVSPRKSPADRRKSLRSAAKSRAK